MTIKRLPADDVVNRYTRLTANFHVWAEEPGLAGAKEIAGAVRRVLTNSLWSQDGFKGIDTRFASARYIRDPDGEHSHGIVQFEVTIEEC